MSYSRTDWIENLCTFVTLSSTNKKIHFRYITFKKPDDY